MTVITPDQEFGEAGLTFFFLVQAVFMKSCGRLYLLSVVLVSQAV